MILFHFYSFTKAQTKNLIVDHLTLQDGLPSEIINCIYQDSFGLIWVGTNNGLVKYDGYDMTIFYHSRVDSNSYNGVWVHSIAEDSKGNLWTAGRELARYSRANSKFINFSYDKVIPFPFVDVNVAHNGYHFSGYNGAFSKILIDKNENLWIGTYSYGLYKLDLNKYGNNPNEPNFKLIFHDLAVEGSQSINSIVEDNVGNIWIATNNGLVSLLSESGGYKIYQSVVAENYNTKNHFTDIVVDNNFLWLSTLGHGICKFSISDGTFEYHSLKSVNETDNFSNSVYTITMDKDHTLWCGMYGRGEYGGIVKFNKHTREKTRYVYDFRKEYSPGAFGPWVNDIFIDNSEVIWISYRFGPLDKIKPERNFIKYVAPEDFEFDEIINPIVYAFQMLNNSEVLLLTSGGILSYNFKSGSFKQKYPYLNKKIQSKYGYKCLLLDSKNKLWIGYSEGILKYFSTSDSISIIKTGENIKSEIVEDKNEIYWIATFGDGLMKYNDRTKEVRYFKHNPNDQKTIKDDYLNCIYVDDADGIWLGTNGGWVTRFDKGTETAENFHSKASVVQKIGKFTKDDIWIATGTGGFQVIDTQTKTKRIYKSEVGLPNGFVQGAIEDTSGFFWIITDNAVTKFDPELNELHNFNAENSTNWFWDYYTYDADNDIIYIAGNKGFFYFSPHELKLNSNPPKMLFTDIKIFNKSLKIHKDSILTEHINVVKDITIPYYKNDFTIEYSAIHNVEPSKNQYKYMLENYDKEWRNVGFEKTARYTSLPHGKYIFKVLGSNSDGIWATEPAALSITILPPWWLTWWAYMIYVLAIISLLTYAWSIQKRRIRIRHEMVMKDFESQKLKEVDQMKSKFFANISHEFRTPLTLIKGPVERLLKKENADDKRKIYKVVLRNSERLLNLINELLDLSKLESGKMKLSAQKADIASFTKGIAMSFESFARGKKIQISITTSRDIIEVYFDKEKMQKILTNLLSNAFKFTNESGKITLRIEENRIDKRVIIKIKDSGIGITEEELPKIFDRFYQVSNTDSTDHIGTGIGLSLTKELVEMHGGKISAESEVSKGSEFTISLLLGKEHLKEEELIYAEEDSDTKYEDEEEEIETTENAVKDKPLILVVEDNKDVRDFIIGIIESEYKYEEVENGKEGLNKAIELMPDLIISDIMMPKLTGDLMCSQLKKDQITSHIPIILLTAKASGEDKISGLETGADDYLIKPFNDKELLARINNLILLRRKLREKYLREAEIHPAEVAVTSFDKKFIEKVLDIVEKNISDNNFDVESFANELVMSRRQLYRKFDSILGEKPNDFIRKYRINRAAELIKQNYDSITQIAYAVGFNDVSYFSKCFKQIYNISPQQYEKSK